MSAIDEHLAGIGTGQAGNALHQHRLARAVAADKAVYAAALQGDGDVVKHLLGSVGFGDFLQLDHMRSSFFMLRCTLTQAKMAHSSASTAKAYHTGGKPAPSP